MKIYSLILKIIITLLGIFLIFNDFSVSSGLNILFFILVLLFFILDTFVFKKNKNL